MVGLLGRYRNQDTVARLERILAGAGQDPVSDRTVQSHRRYPRLTPEDIEAMVKARGEGAEINQLAEQFGVNRNAVMERLQKAGVPGRRWPGRTLSPERLEEAGRLYESGLNLVKVSEQVGVTRRYLRFALPAAGFPLRSPGRQKTQSSD